MVSKYWKLYSEKCMQIQNPKILRKGFCFFHMPVTLSGALTFEVVDSYIHFIYREPCLEYRNFELRLPKHLFVRILMSLYIPELPLLSELSSCLTIYNEYDITKTYKAFRLDCEFRCKGKHWSRKKFTVGGPMDATVLYINPSGCSVRASSQLVRLQPMQIEKIRIYLGEAHGNTEV